jgi:hypothetical protein
MLELLRIFLPTLAKLFRKRRDLLVENLLLRHQLQVELRSRPRPDLKTRDRFFWLLVRRIYPDGSSISSWFDRKPSSAGTAKAGASTGAGAQATTSAGLD